LKVALYISVTKSGFKPDKGHWWC